MQQPLQLHPMTLSDILDKTFALYRRNFALFAGIVAILYVPLTILNVVFALQTTSAIVTTTSTGESTFNASAALTAALLGLLVTFVTFVFTLLITGALATAISARFLGEPMTIEQAYGSVGVAGFVRLILGSFLVGIMVAFGLILLIVPGIYLYVRFLFVPEAIVLERTSITGALRRSGQLVVGTWWRVFGISIVLSILVGIIGGVGGAVGGVVVAAISGDLGTALRSIISAIFSIAAMPIQVGSLIMLYYDLRIRKEGFDLEQMARTLQAGGGPIGTGPSWDATSNW